MTSKAKPKIGFDAEGNPTFVDISGMSLPWAAVDLALELEGRNIRMIVDGDKLRLSTGAGERPELTLADVDRIKRWKPHLMELASWLASLEDDLGAHLRNATKTQQTQQVVELKGSNKDRADM